MRFLLLYTFALTTILLTASGCDLLDDDDDDKASSGGTEQITSLIAAADSETATATEDTTAVPQAVTLSAFSDFSCSSNWTNRDGALGLEANSGSGTCTASFPGVSGRYRITLTIQTEFDGEPRYSLSINNQTISSGQYPLSSSLACDCPKDNWWEVCPDKNVEIDAGTHLVSTNDTITFYGEEQWNCNDHGAYAKWHQISFVPAD